jgi:hypothetical protein
LQTATVELPQETVDFDWEYWLLLTSGDGATQLILFDTPQPQHDAEGGVHPGVVHLIWGVVLGTLLVSLNAFAFFWLKRREAKKVHVASTRAALLPHGNVIYIRPDACSEPLVP